MTTLTIFTDNSLKGKYQIEVSNSTQLMGVGISKAKHCGDLNCYFVTKKAIENLKKSYECVEISKW